VRLVVVYSALALAATVANIGSQVAVTAIYTAAHSVLISVLVGTGVGLWLKYMLDKRYIFRFRTRGIGHESRIFILYSVMGVLTTSVFWIVEFGFYAYFERAEMRYVGGVLGLAVGYWMKYQLDKQYVFVPASTGTMME
jgi:putative flippase GtrA